MPSLTTLLAAAEEGGHEASKSGEHALNMVGLFFYFLLTLAVIVGFLWAARKQLSQNKVFKTFPLNCFEQLYLFLENMAVGIIGPHGRKYLPMVMSFWLVIFVGSFISLFFPSAPTADLSFNLGLALCAVGYVQWEGMKSNGVLGHFKHFSGPKLGGVLVLVSVMIFVIELVSELMKNVSLSLRLYGNIEGGHKAVEAMNALGGDWVPVGAFLFPIKLMTCIVQALIFSLLFCVYLSLVTHHEEHGDGHAPAH